MFRPNNGQQQRVKAEEQRKRLMGKEDYAQGRLYSTPTFLYKDSGRKRQRDRAEANFASQGHRTQSQLFFTKAQGAVSTFLYKDKGPRAKAKRGKGPRAKAEKQG